MASNTRAAQTAYNNAPIGFFFFLIFIGAAIYFIGQAQDFWGVIIGFFKACVWPVLLTLEVFNQLQL